MKRMMIDEGLIVLFMFAYQILMAIEKEYGRGLLHLNDDMVGTPTRKGLGFQQIYGVANLISKHERGRKLVLHGLLHEWVR